MYAQMLAKQNGGSSSSGPTEPAKLVIEPLSATVPSEGVLVIFGSTNWKEMGKKVGEQDEDFPNLMGPHRLISGLNDVKLAFIVSGCTSVHCIALSVDGEAFSWGRNDAAQLGHGDTVCRPGPTRVEAAKGRKLVSASTGKAHSLFVTDGGAVLACGASKQGAVGAALTKKSQEFEAKLVTVSGLPSIASVASGNNFNLAVDQDGEVWAWGWSEFGVMGNGTDGCYNQKDGAVKLTYEIQSTPRAILKLKGHKMVQVACGNQHCAAVESDGMCYTWGSGGYGRLGHKDQKDKWVPSALPEMRAKSVSCGNLYTAAVGHPVLRDGSVCIGQASFYMWGRCKSATQDSWMYPKPHEDLSGWKIHSAACGHSHNAVHADSSLITWGSACLSGELGYGEGDKKSSSRPKKVDIMEGAKVAQIACGLANTLLLVELDPEVEKLPAWEPPAPDFTAKPEPAAKGAVGGKRKGPPASVKAKGKAKK